jgi:hypothetical protein
MQFELAQERLHDLVADTPEARWNVRPAVDRWSVAECVAHLNLTAQAYIPMLRDAFSDARFAGVPAPRLYRRDAMGWVVSMTAGPLPRLGRRRFGRVKTIPAFVPGGALERAATVAEFDRLHADLIELTRDAEGRPLEQMKIVSPFDARISYNAYSCLVILPRHEQRHLWQAEHAWDAH